MRTRSMISWSMSLMLVGACSSGTSDEDSAVPAETSPPSTATDLSVATPEVLADAPDPCLILTTAEIDAATRLTFGDGAVNETVTQENQTACDWVAVSGLGIVQVLVLTVDVFDSSRDSASEVLGVVDVSVPGVSRAYATADGSIVGMDMGGAYLQVSFLSSDQPDVTEATLQLAAAAAAAAGPLD